MKRISLSQVLSLHQKMYGGQSCQDIFLPLYKVDSESSFPQ